MGTVLLLLEALLEHGALGGGDVLACVTSATLCLCEFAPADLRVSAAGMAVLDAALSLSLPAGTAAAAGARGDRCFDGDGSSTREGRDNRDDGASDGSGVGCGARGLERAAAAGLMAISSSRVLAAVESVLQFRDGGRGAASDTPLPDIDHTSSSSFSSVSRLCGFAQLDGSCFGAPVRGMLDAPASLLARLIAGTTSVPPPAVGTAVSPVVTGSPSRRSAAPVVAATSLSHQRLWPRLCNQLERGGSGQLSPAGLVCALRYAEGVLLTSPAVEDVKAFLLGGEAGEEEEEEEGETDGLVGVVCASVLDHQHLQAVLEWPLLGGGGGGGAAGAAGVAALVTAAVGAMLAPLAADGTREALLRVQQSMHARGLVAALLGATRVLRGCGTGNRSDEEKNQKTLEAERARINGGGDGDGWTRGGVSGRSKTCAELEAAVCACVELLSRLVLLSPHFSLQFLDEGGLDELVSAGALQGSAPAALATGALVIASQLARASPDNYDRLRAAGVDARLGGLLSHEDPTVRAKACNLVGNLCRHSAYFYAALREGQRGGTPEGGEALLPMRPPPRHREQQQQPAHSGRQGGAEDKSVVDHLVDLCADADPAARKFACFAVGNAAFHSDALYARLAPAVAPLVAALGDAEEKTRANAAGALGNLVRNGGALSASLARSGGVAILLGLAARDPAPSPRRIALFSLGTCFAYIPCREALALLLEREEGGGRDRSPHGSGGGSGGWDTARQRWAVGNVDAASLPPAPRFSGATAAAAAGAATVGDVVPSGSGLDRLLSELEGMAVAVGDDVARKYVARLRTKLSAPPQS